MDFLQLMRERYTAKYYDPHRQVSRGDLDWIIECTRLSPSSTNLQPWHLYVAYGQEQIDRWRPFVRDFNQERLNHATALVAFCCLSRVKEEHFAMVAAKEWADGRFRTRADAEAGDAGRRRFAAMRSHSEEAMLAWTSRSTYMAMTTMMYAASSIGVDSTCMEGFDEQLADELLDLRRRNLHCICLLSLGYASAEDTNTHERRPQSRIDSVDFVTFV